MIQIRRDWFRKTSAGAILGLSLAIALAGLFAWLSPGGLENSKQISARYVACRADLAHDAEPLLSLRERKSRLALAGRRESYGLRRPVRLSPFPSLIGTTHDAQRRCSTL